MQLPDLNFSQKFEFKIRQDKDKFFIYNLPRKSWLVLTPEEWVRQHWLQYFMVIKKYAVSALITEKKLVLNGLTKRIDLLVTEKNQARILIECKAPGIPLTEKTFEQTARYNSVLLVPKIILSNGLQHITAEYSGGNYTFIKEEY